MTPKILALIGVAGLIAGALMPLAPAMGAESSGALPEGPYVDRPLGAFEINAPGDVSDDALQVPIRCDESAVWFGALCQLHAKIET